MAEISNKSNIEYPIYRGPLHVCNYCLTMFITEEFLNRHQKKCIHAALLSLLKSKLQLKRNHSNKVAKEAEDNLLPTKSKQRYENTYDSFKAWCIQKGVKNLGSETVLLAYFSEMARTKKASTLWSAYSMLRTTLRIKVRTDISKFGKLLAFLKKQNVGYKAKKSCTFTMENIEKFLNHESKDILNQKVALIIGVSGACRSNELYMMGLEDVNCLENKVSIEIKNTKTYQSRAFMITNKKWIDIIKEYINLRKSIQNDRFFMQIRFGHVTKQPIGHNSISQFPKKIAAFLKLPNTNAFTGHCFRRTAATLLANSGRDIMQLKRLGGWKSSSVAEGYVDGSVINQVKTAGMISNNMSIEDAGTTTSHTSTTQHIKVSSKSFTKRC